MKKSKKGKWGVQLFRNILKLTKIKDEDLKNEKKGGGVQLCRNILKLTKI